MQTSIRVWDAPTRLFHWAVVVLIATSWVSIHNGWMLIHFVSGYSMTALLLFRVAWGFVGSETSRFASFLGSPLAALRHLAQFGRREPDRQVGHNAAGGWMVLVMLLVLAAQVVTGLCANDDLVTEGPFASAVGKHLSDRLSIFHALNFNLILALGGAHVLAIAAYAVVKRHDLVRPMLTGRKRLPAGVPAPRMVTPLLALLVLACAAGVVLSIATAP
jgi:cytochrome b